MTYKKMGDRMTKVEIDLTYIKNKLDDINSKFDNLDKRFANKLTEKIVYGVVALILLAFFTKISGFW